MQKVLSFQSGISKNSLRSQNSMLHGKYVLATNLFDIHPVQLNYCRQICMINSTLIVMANVA